MKPSQFVRKVENRSRDFIIWFRLSHFCTNELCLVLFTETFLELVTLALYVLISCPSMVVISWDGRCSRTNISCKSRFRISSISRSSGRHILCYNAAALLDSLEHVQSPFREPPQPVRAFSSSVWNGRIFRQSARPPISATRPDIQPCDACD